MMSPPVEADGKISESRRRQSKRDEAIRRKIENDLNKKKRTNARTTRFKKAPPGTVLSLKPSSPIICSPSSTVYEAAQLMSAKRVNCILVQQEQKLLGIFTAKDLAFRIVGSGINANTVTIDLIMTPNPMCAYSNTPASEALNLMVTKGFRHLPVLDSQNNVVGVLDITRCYARQVEKLERMHASSRKLYEALDSVNSEIGMIRHPLHIFEYFEQLRKKMSGPTLGTVLSDSTTPIYTSVKTSVYDATVLMKNNNTTAVLVKDTNEEVAGIFTSKDVVLRVIATGLDPTKCSIVRVMTPQPDTAVKEASIQEALKQMLDGRFLNLPVVGDEDKIVGMVDVLRLTYAILNQIKQTECHEPDDVKSGSETAVNKEGPAWNKFWTSLDQEETDSLHIDPGADSSFDQGMISSEIKSSGLDIKPSDSISHLESFVTSDKPQDDLLSLRFSFKIRIPGDEKKVYRVSLDDVESVLALREIIDTKLNPQDWIALKTSEPDNDYSSSYAISYIDDDGDVISITSDSDITECVTIFRSLGRDRATLYLHNPNERAVLHETASKQREYRQDKRLVKWVPNEVLLPGALAILASSVIVGLTFGKK